MQGEGRIVHRETDYEEALIRGAFLVIGATDSDAVNGRIAMDARALGIPVNIVDDPARCDFILPSVVERGDLAIAVSTGGKSPALAKKLRTELEDAYGPEYAILLRDPGGAPGEGDRRRTTLRRESGTFRGRRLFRISWITSARGGGKR